jgi:peroxiredoxin Q/BCP
VQADGFRDHQAEIVAARAVVLGISPDPIEKLRKWREKQGYPFDLLSDPDHAVLARLGAWGEKTNYGKTYEGVIRSHWVFGPDGELIDAQIKVSPADSVVKALAALRSQNQTK